MQELATPDRCAGLPRECKVTVKAESEDDKNYEWTSSLAFTERLETLVENWAKSFQIPKHVVGIHDAKGDELDIAKTPAQLEWADAIEVYAFPKEEEYMEEEQDEPVTKVIPARAAAPMSGSMSPDVGHYIADNAMLGNMLAAEELEPKVKPERVPGEKALPKVKQEESKKVKLEQTPLQSTSSDGSPASKRPRKEVLRKTSPAGGKSAAESSPLGTAQRTETTPSSSSVRPKAKAATLGDFSAAQGGATTANGSTGAVPGPDERIVFKQTNPKRAGSGAFKRYEEYKVATSIKEAMALKAAKGDIEYDWKKGYFTRQ